MESRKPNKRKMKKPVKVSKRRKLKKDDASDEERETSEVTSKIQRNQEEMEDNVLFKCRICEGEQEMKRTELKIHYRTHHKGRRVPRNARMPSMMQSCEICSKNFKSSKNLNAHMETHNNKFLCGHCHLSFRKDIDYILHSRTHCPDNQFKCAYCDFTTTNVKDVSLHLSCYHEKKHRYTCKICNKGFDVLTWFEEHDNFHTGNKPFKCEFCGKTFLYSRYLAAHKSSMHKEEITGVAKIYECAVCNKQYQHRNSLKLHMNSHTGNVAICDICGKQLSSKEKLKFHVRIHTGYKPFKCRYCDKSFTKKPILVEHERIHTGERPYNCDYCHKAFSQRSSLVIHMRTHTGEKPFVCHVCNKGFVARAMLNIHFKNCKGY